MSKQSDQDFLAEREQALGGAFYQAEAERHRGRLQLQVQEQNARDQIAEATGVTDSHVLAELAGLGIRVDTLAALTLIPLIEVAWVDGEMDERERNAVLEAAVNTGIEHGSTSYRLLEIWMMEQPPPDLTVAWQEFIRALSKQLPGEKADRLAANLLGRARDVAAAAGTALDRSPHVSSVEESCLAELQKAFQG
jgi:hypothetical protein